MVYFLCEGLDDEDHIARMRKDRADSWLRHEPFARAPTAKERVTLCGRHIARFLRQRPVPGRHMGRFRRLLCADCIDVYGRLNGGRMP